jgi:hypothetical protein
MFVVYLCEFVLPYCFVIFSDSFCYETRLANEYQRIGVLTVSCSHVKSDIAIQGRAALAT